MRGKQLRPDFSSLALRLSCLSVCIILVIGTLAGCGSSSASSTTGGGTATTVASVAATCTPAAINGGGTSSCTATVQGNGNPSQSVTWTVSPSSAGTMSSGGTFTAASVSAKATATASACSVVPGYTTICGSFAITVSPAAPTITISANPATITLGQSTTIAWSSSGCPNGLTAGGAWSGSQPASGSATETPAATGTATYTLSCTGPGGSANQSAAVTVNAVPVPNVTGVSLATIYLMGLSSQSIVNNVELTGSNFASSDTVYPTEFNNILIEQLVSSTQISLSLQFGATGYSPGWLTFAVCQNANDTGCGTSQTIAFLGALNYLGIGQNGNILFYDQTQGNSNGALNGIVRTYNAGGTQTNQCFVATQYSMAVDNKTPYMLIDESIYNSTGPNSGTSCDYGDAPNPQGMPSGTVNANAADNGYAGFVQTANNSASFYDMTGGTGSQPTVYTASNLGTEPVTIAMGTYGGETDAFVLSVGGTNAVLNDIRASDAYVKEKPLTLSGITPIGTVQATNYTTGGWQIIAFEGTSPASGTIAVLSTYDNLLVLVDEATWTVTASIPLTADAKGNPIGGTPFRIAADAPAGTVIVAYANPSAVTTTYASVDAVAGTKPVPLTATSTLLSVGLGISSDGTTIYSSQRNQLQILQNK